MAQLQSNINKDLHNTKEFETTSQIPQASSLNETDFIRIVKDILIGNQ